MSSPGSQQQTPPHMRRKSVLPIDPAVMRDLEVSWHERFTGPQGTATDALRPTAASTMRNSNKRTLLLLLRRTLLLPSRHNNTPLPRPPRFLPTSLASESFYVYHERARTSFGPLATRKRLLPRLFYTCLQTSLPNIDTPPPRRFLEEHEWAWAGRAATFLAEMYTMHACLLATRSTSSWGEQRSPRRA